ncbi:MAG: UDP-N-acetylmuramoyl-tripeptide--D-alanyl-D-alanine ligase [Flavobacteriaceae bacterium]|nr:UDP-N-acetylmuramoyl-tripeptide--D-alanyl-D-alanine ligase [Flavobacteriaceae bacterium]
MIEINKIYKLFIKSSGVYTDTRKPLINGIFIALRGSSFNGNNFGSKAIKQGACLAIVDDFNVAEKSERFIYVEDTYSTLKNLANYHRKKLKCPVFAITGSNGKTTTKELVKAVMQEKFKTNATIGNLNNHIGVPLTLLNTPLSAEFTIIEMGANHLNEIKKLCEIAEPTHGYITNFGKAHIEGFGSEIGIMEGKSELYNYLSNSGGIIFVNIDNQNQVKKLNKIPFISFGKSKKSNYPIAYNKNTTNKLDLTFKGFNFISELHGNYNLQNLAAAIVIGNYFKVPINKIQKTIELYKSNNNRSQFLKLKNYNIILDAYNANPSSMEVAIKSFHESYSRKSVLIIGDMLELGDYALTAHYEIISLAKTLSFSRIISVGENFKNVEMPLSNFDKFSSTNELIKHLKSNPIKEKNILIKGSRSLGLEKILVVF